MGQESVLSLIPLAASSASSVCFRLIAPGKQGHHQPDPPCSAPLVTGDYCYVIADTFGIDLETLQGINPQLNCELIQPSESF